MASDDGAVVAAFNEAFLEASEVDLAGSAVYADQDVRGLSDQDPAAPLVATLHLCGGVAVTLGSGAARVDRRFLAQSCFKPLCYAMALEHGMGGQVATAVGHTGDQPFHTFDRAADGRCLNPLINSGALAVLELLSRAHTIDEVGSWCRGIGGIGGIGGTRAGVEAPLFDSAAVAATEADSMRNRALSSALAAAGIMPKTDDAVDRAVRYCELP